MKESIEVGAKVSFGDVLGPLRILAFWLYGRKVIDVSLRYDEILERVLKQHENSGELKRDDEDLMDILLKVYQDDKAEFKINRTHLRAFLLVSHGCFCVCFFIPISFSMCFYFKTSLSLSLISHLVFSYNRCSFRTATFMLQFFFQL